MTSPRLAKTEVFDFVQLERQPFLVQILLEGYEAVVLAFVSLLSLSEFFN